MSTSVVHQGPNALEVSGGGMMSITDMRQQIVSIQTLMKSVMRDGEHYGTIPGCGDKKTLMKSGAEKISFAFRLGTELSREVVDLGNGHRDYQITCVLRNINTGLIWGTGVGSCSTLESKYRYRFDNTNRPVPAEYWETKDNAFLGGPQYTVRKVRDRSGRQSWVIYERIEHDNPADYWNTCLKMASKRAHVAAVLAATAASDIFTQDIEDYPEELQGAVADEGMDAPPQEAPPKEPPRRTAPAASAGTNGATRVKPNPKDLDDFYRDLLDHFEVDEKIEGFLSNATEGRVRSVDTIVSAKQLGYLRGQFEKVSGGAA